MDLALMTQDQQLVARYVLDFLHQWRQRIRTQEQQPLCGGWEKLAPVAQELYWRLRSATTAGDIVQALRLLEQPCQGAAANRDLCLVLEFAEDLLRECFDALHWSEAHQRQMEEAAPKIQRHLLMSFMQATMQNVRVLGVERTAQVVKDVTLLLQSHSPEQCFTREQIETLFLSVLSVSQ